ncbi:hypothetical protein [Phytohabitans rumicis]|nr:hypothetical protein [Phytohabitans rumicis]
MTIVTPAAPTVASRRPHPFRWYGVALGERVSLVALADDGDPLRTGRDRLTELSEKWSPHGRRSEIARLNAYPGVMLPVCADTVRLATRLATSDVLVDARHSTVGRRGDRALDPGAAAQALAAELVLDDMLAAGARSATVTFGARRYSRRW